MKIFSPRIAAVLSTITMMAHAQASTCYGTPSNGRLHDGAALPASGENFVPYSRLAITLGRTHVHATVRDIVVDAYQATYLTAPTKRYMYGETGLATGGPFKPHRTHQTGTSVDFMVPVLDGQGKTALLPTSALNKFGYGLEFDKRGELGDLRIDFEALAEHLYQLAQSADRHGSRIDRVIFDTAYLPQLYETPRGSYLRDKVTFMTTKPWIRHDEHYHVDFGIACRPLQAYRGNAGAR